MNTGSSRFFFAGLIGVSIGFLAGFLTATQLDTGRPAPPPAAPSGGPPAAAPGAAAQLPEGHPPIDFQKEIQASQQVLQGNPQDFTALTQMGNVHYDMGQFADAITWYTKALEVRPDDPNVRTDLGTCYHYVGDHAGAVREFETVLAREPGFAHALHNLGVVRQFGLNDSKGAVQAWEKLLELHPNYPAAAQVRDNLARLKSGKPL